MTKIKDLLPENVLIQYIRNKNNNQLIGVVVAIGPNFVGWSLCNKKDKFDKTIALKIALGRANKLENLYYIDNPFNFDVVPNSIKNIYEKMIDRSIAYFKKY